MSSPFEPLPDPTPLDIEMIEPVIDFVDLTLEDDINLSESVTDETTNDDFENQELPDSSLNPLPERKTPKFNKSSKLVHDLRKFESQLIDVILGQIDGMARSGELTWKHGTSNIDIELEISFEGDEEAQDVDVSVRKVSVSEVIDKDVKDDRSDESIVMSPVPKRRRPGRPRKIRS